MSSKTILTNDEVAAAIGVDPDYPEAELLLLAQAATSFVNNKTGWSGWADEDPIEPAAKDCARLYVQQRHFNSDGYDKEHDFALGINCLIEDLKDLARGKEA